MKACLNRGAFSGSCVRLVTFVRSSPVALHGHANNGTLGRPAGAVGAVGCKKWNRDMKTTITALTSRRCNLVAAALLLAGAVGGWAISSTVAASAAATEAKKQQLDEGKARLIGSYEVSGTDANGKPYVAGHTLGIALAPSGALEVEWDDGKNVGVGEIVGNVLAVASWVNGKTVILTMQINPDGSLSGKWLRRTDRGTKGTETWTRI
jgi:hypothetical protein